MLRTLLAALSFVALAGCASPQGGRFSVVPQVEVVERAPRRVSYSVVPPASPAGGGGTSVTVESAGSAGAVR